MDNPYYLLLRYDGPISEGATVCGTYREDADDPSKLRSAPAHVSVQIDDYRLAREHDEWRFRPERGSYKELPTTRTEDTST